MADPKLQIELAFERLQEGFNRVEEAVKKIAEYMTSMPEEQKEEIRKILRGEKTDASEESEAESMGVRSEGEELGNEAPLQQQGETTEDKSE